MGTTSPDRSILRLFRRILAAGAVTVAVMAPAGCSTQTPVTTLRERGDHHFKRGEYELAVNEYRAIVERYPGDWYAQMRLGQTYMESGRYGQAVQALEIAQSTRPGYTEIEDALAEAMFRGGDVNQLIRQLNERVASGGTVADYLRLAKYSLLTDDPDAAREAVDQAILLDDGRRVEPLLAAADLAERVGDRNEALLRYRQAYNVNPRDPRVLDGLRGLGEVPGPTLAMPTER